MEKIRTATQLGHRLEMCALLEAKSEEKPGGFRKESRAEVLYFRLKLISPFRMQRLKSKETVAVLEKS